MMKKRIDWISVILILLITVAVAWADLKITQMTEDTAPSTDDLVMTVNDPSGSPANRKVTLSNLSKGIELDKLNDVTGFGTQYYLLQDDGDGTYSFTNTITSIIIDADDNTLQDFPYDIAWSLVDPADADIHYIRLQRALTLSSIGCIVDPEGTGESVVLDILECDSNGDTCVSALSSTITCANTPTAGTISDGAWDSSDFIKIDIGTVTGTVKTLSIYGVGKETY